MDAGDFFHDFPRRARIGTLWAISVRLPDMQIIDFALMGRRAGDTVDE
jgi:hypothetical protein